MKKIVNSLFDAGANLREIRHYLFQIPHRHPSLSQLRGQNGFENLTKEEYKIFESDFYIEREFYDRIILRDLDCESYDDYNKKKKSRKSRKEQNERGGAAWRKAKKQARARDGEKCVITGVTKQLFVHHINGDKTDNRLENLVTVSRKVNDAIHHGARDFHPDDLQHWKQRNPDYVSKAFDRLEVLKKYIDWLRENGFKNACLESLPLHEIESNRWRIGLNEELHFSTYRKRNYQNHLWVALLEPTGIIYEKQSFEEIYKKKWGRSYFDDGYEEEKCVDCPYDSDPPCGDYTPGPYCISQTEGDQSCINCMFNSTEGCPFFEIGNAEEIQSCSQWHEILDSG